jgi:hypothetical protein
VTAYPAATAATSTGDLPVSGMNAALISAPAASVTLNITS